MVITLLRQFKDAYADTHDQLPVEVYKALKISSPQQYQYICTYFKTFLLKLYKYNK